MVDILVSFFWAVRYPTFIKHFGLTSQCPVLDVRCAKCMLHDLKLMVPGTQCRGIDISEYAIENAIDDMLRFLSVGDTRELQFPDKSSDVVVSINTIYNLDRGECAQVLKEIE